MPKSSLRSSSAERRQKYALVLDAGTTGVKAFVFDEAGRIVSKAYYGLRKFSPHSGWVEQDPKEIFQTSVRAIRRAVKLARVDACDYVGLGITNQRETTVLWDKKTGQPVYPAVVWEDKRTRRFCVDLERKWGSVVIKKTGLPIDSYFSASKIRWILDHVKSASTLASKDRLAFGTIDSWLLWNLCKEHPHATDETNASRTLLFDIRTRTWDKGLLDIFGIPISVLPDVRPSQNLYGHLEARFLGFALPVAAVCGDQQASMYATMDRLGNFHGATKVTYGTGTFVMQTLGLRFSVHPPFFTTLVPGHNGSLFALEAKIEGSAAGVEKVLGRPSALHRYLVGLARKTDRLIKMLPKKPTPLVIDGGITRDGLLAEIQARVSGLRVVQQQPHDGTALGVAKLLLKSKC